MKSNKGRKQVWGDKCGAGVDPWADLWDWGQHSKLNCPTLLGKSWPNRAAAEGQCRHCLVKTALTTLHKLAVLPHLTIPTNLVDRRNQISLTSQSPGDTTSELLLICWYQDWTPKENSRTFTKRLNFLWWLNLVFLLCGVFFEILTYIIPILLTSPSLFFYPYSHPLYFPAFSFATIHCSPSQLLFLSLLIHSFPHLHLPFLSSSALSPHYPSLYTLSTCWLA
jgi:hypothetical protein